MSGGFADLRLNHTISEEGGSFWPSFTDIMMVVVMIFMLASTVLILRNWELVEELRNTIEAEREAKQLVAQTSQTNATLEEQLAQSQHLISELRMQLMQRMEAHQLQTQMLKEQEQVIQSQEKQIVELEQNRLQLDQQNFEINQQLLTTLQDLQTAKELLAALKDEFIQKVVELEQTSSKYLQLQQTHQAQTEAYTQLQQSYSTTKQRFDLIQGELDQLQVKYDKLVQPARTAKGKHVAEVRYEKTGKTYRIRFKAPGSDIYKILDRKTLDSNLTLLKKRYKKQLYIKIIIPEDSGLSYSEAWEFTKGILEKYDYYYQ